MYYDDVVDIDAYNIFLGFPWLYDMDVKHLDMSNLNQFEKGEK